MKSPVVLLVSNDPAVVQPVQEALPAIRHGLRIVRSTQEAFRQLQHFGEEFDFAIIDLDPGLHGSALLEAISGRVPMLAVTSLEENYMDPIVRRHGAFASLSKPFTADRLAFLVNSALRESTAAV